ncbi:MAG: hypothetical protein ABIG43_03610 [Chloroflexota bacterium]
MTIGETYSLHMGENSDLIYDLSAEKCVGRETSSVVVGYLSFKNPDTV